MTVWAIGWRHIQRVRRVPVVALGRLVVWYERVGDGTCLSAVQKTTETRYFGGTADGHRHVRPWSVPPVSKPTGMACRFPEAFPPVTWPSVTPLTNQSRDHHTM